MQNTSIFLTWSDCIVLPFGIAYCSGIAYCIACLLALQYQQIFRRSTTRRLSWKHNPQTFCIYIFIYVHMWQLPLHSFSGWEEEAEEGPIGPKRYE